MGCVSIARASWTRRHSLGPSLCLVWDLDVLVVVDSVRLCWKQSKGTKLQVWLCRHAARSRVHNWIANLIVKALFLCLRPPPPIIDCHRLSREDANMVSQCSICLSNFKNPVCLPCGELIDLLFSSHLRDWALGHLYCKKCLNEYVNAPGNTGMTANCPDCRTPFHLGTRLVAKPIPVLLTSTRPVVPDVCPPSCS